MRLASEIVTPLVVIGVVTQQYSVVLDLPAPAALKPMDLLIFSFHFIGVFIVRPLDHHAQHHHQPDCPHCDSALLFRITLIGTGVFQFLLPLNSGRMLIKRMVRPLKCWCIHRRLINTGL